MLSFRNIFRVWGNLKLVVTSDCPLNGIFNTYGPNPRVLNCSFLTFGLFSTENKKERFPLEELNNINVNRFNCDVSKWHTIADEIMQGKVSGKKVPDYLKEEEINSLLKHESRSQRFKYLEFLFKRERKKINQVEKQQRRKAERAIRLSAKNELTSNHIEYGLGKNCLIFRTSNRSKHKFYDKRLANAVLFGQKIVIDLSYDEFMWLKEKRDLVAQLALVHGINRKNVHPYDIYLCNAKPESESVAFLHRVIPNVDDSLITVTEQSYLDLFPKENLVYLSPHAAEPLKTYDHNAIYIIGGFVDTVKKNHISFSKSQEEGIKSYFLPLDEYVAWGNGSKSLSINQVFSIMQTLKDTSDWKQAFKHIPTRKLKRIKADSEQVQYMSDKLFVMYN